MYRSLRKMKPAARRAFLMDNVQGILDRANKASRFLNDAQKTRLADAAKYLEAAAINVAAFSVTSRNVDKAAIAETFDFIQRARDIAHKIDVEAERLADELMNV